MKRHFYRPSEGHRLPHNPFKAIVAPRPIGWIGTRGAGGVNNLAPYSFFNAFSDAPPIVGFCSIGRKDTVTNAELTGCFSWNLATYALAEPMSKSSLPVSSEEDEFMLSGMNAVDCSEVDAPRVEQAQVSFECRTTQCIQLLDATGTAHDCWLLLGEVVGVHIDEALLLDGIYQTVAAKPIMRGGGTKDFFTIDESSLFHMERPADNR